MISEKEIENIVKLSHVERYKYCIKKIADFEEVWLLNNDDGYAINIEDDDSKYLPIWPFKEFSDLWISGAFSKYNSTKIDVYNFKDNMLPKLIKANINILVFPTETEKGFIMNINEFKNSLSAELSQYE